MYICGKWIFTICKGSSINHVTGGRVGLNFWKKRHENVTRGGGGDFQNPQRAILTFLNSEFCIFPMNLVVLAQDFQNQICFIAQGILSWFSLWHYIHTCIPKMTLKFCNNFYLQYYRWEENKGNQEGSMIQYKKESWLFVKSQRFI